MSYRIPLAYDTFSHDDRVAAADLFLSGSQLTMGDYCAEFENRAARTLGHKHAVFVNSGSSANLLAFFLQTDPGYDKTRQCRGWQRGSEVIVPALTWSTTIWPICQADGIPVLVDSDPETLQMRVDGLESLINDRTFGICVPHIMGNAVEMAEIVRLCEKHQLTLIEDCCEAMGVIHNHRPVGSFGSVCTYSTYFSHHITTVEGGLVCTDDDDIADVLRSMRSHGWIRGMSEETRSRYTRFRPQLDPRYLFATTGFNLRPTEVGGLLGIRQIAHLQDWQLQRNLVAQVFTGALLHLTGMVTPMRITQGTTPSWFGFPMLCVSRSVRDAFKEHLEACGVETRPIVCGNIARHPAMAGVQHLVAGDLAGADAVMNCGIYIGISPAMPAADIAYVAETLGKFGGAAVTANS